MKLFIRFLILVLYSVSFISCSSSGKVSNQSDTEIKILPRSFWNADPPKSFATHLPERITIHHEGEYLDPKENAAEKIKRTQVWCMGPERNWSDIPYHFLIDLDGNIYEGRNVYTAGETNTTYDPSGHLLLTCMGNFEEQDLPEVQLNSLIKLAAYCCKKYQIDPASIKGHKDYAETLCPGKNLYPFIQNGYIINKVKELIKK